MDLKEIGVRVWTGVNRLKTGSSIRFLWTW